MTGRGELLLDHAVARVTLHNYGAAQVLRLEGRMSPTAEQVRGFMPLYTELARRHAPCRVVTDLRQFVSAPLSVHLEYAKFLKRLRPHVVRSSVFGLRPSTGALVRLVLRLSGRHDMRVVNTEAEALDWVLEGSHEAAC